MKIYSCIEDVELALEAVIDETQEAPFIKELTEEQRLSTSCEYCRKRALYIVTNTHSDT